MPSPNNAQLKTIQGKEHVYDASILTSAVENVFRKLIRMLIGHMSLKKLQEMIQVIFVEEAEAKLQSESPGKNAPLTTLAVIAGYDTRRIVKIRGNSSYLKPFHKEERFLSSITPECSVLDVWESNPEFIDPTTGKPKVLKLHGSGCTFESLVARSIPTRGVTVTSFLQRLEASRSVVFDKLKSEVRMTDKSYTPSHTDDKSESLKIGLAVVGNLVDTISYNLNAASQSDELFYQRGCWTNRLRKSDRKKLRNLVKEFLLKADEGARNVIGPFEQSNVSADQLTAGVSMFYFEEHAQN